VPVVAAGVRQRRPLALEPANAAAQIEQGRRLLDSGAITPVEFEALEAKALA